MTALGSNESLRRCDARVQRIDVRGPISSDARWDEAIGRRLVIDLRECAAVDGETGCAPHTKVVEERPDGVEDDAVDAWRRGDEVALVTVSSGRAGGAVAACGDRRRRK